MTHYAYLAGLVCVAIFCVCEGVLIYMALTAPVIDFDGAGWRQQQENEERQQQENNDANK